MTNQEAIEILQEEHDWCLEPCYVINAIEKAISALRYEPTGKPLTLDQLREMDGKPAWIVPVNDKDWEPHWAVMKRRRFSADSKTVRGRMYFLYENSYGERWIAYAYPPTRIDREAWEPCEDCESCFNCMNHGVINTDDGQCEECIVCMIRPYSEFSPDNFCRSCGHPLTEEGWAMLEKRLRG